MVAAATLGLPERAEAGRNYDYRYVWLRDQAYAGHGGRRSTRRGPAAWTRRWRSAPARMLEHGDAARARPTGSTAATCRDEDALDLPGYPGGTDVVGNWVRGQFQLDMYGELLQLYATAAGTTICTATTQRGARILVDVVEQRWDEPDAGVWELDDAWWTHSRLACVAGLRAVAAHVATPTPPDWIPAWPTDPRRDHPPLPGPDGSWRQAPTGRGRRRSAAAAGPRRARRRRPPQHSPPCRPSTRHLVEDGYVYRYAVDDQPLGEAEGAFLMCGFAMCLAQLAAGDTVEAFRWFERQRAACGPPGLLSEEFDVRQRQLRGNLPQGFVHALLLESSIRLGQTKQGRGAA